jgi:hypothetical protein
LDSYDRNLVVEALRAGARGLFYRASSHLKLSAGAFRSFTRTSFGRILSEGLPSALKSALPRVIDTKERFCYPTGKTRSSAVAEGLSRDRAATRCQRKHRQEISGSAFDKVGVSNRSAVLYVLTRGLRNKRPSPVTCLLLPGDPYHDRGSGTNNLLGQTEVHH